MDASSFDRKLVGYTTATIGSRPESTTDEVLTKDNS
jgi:hypothetical protein